MARTIATRKIGNYIHFYHSNYLKYGIGNREQGRQNESIQKVLSDQKKLILEQSKFLVRPKLSKDQVKEEVEKKLNYFRPQGTFDGKIKVDPLEIENKIRELALKRIKIQDAKINWNTLTVLNSGSFGVERAAIANTKNQARSELSNKGRNSVESIENRIQALKDTYENFISKNSDQVLEYQEQLNYIKNEWDKIQKDLPIVTDFGRQYILGANSFIEDLNKIWNRFSKKVNSYLTGELGEQYGAISAFAYEFFAKKTGENIITDFENEVLKMSNRELKVAAKNRSASVLSSEFFAVSGKNKNVSSNHFLEGNLFTNFFGGKAKLYYTQDKVDLEISLSKGKDISASIKNYNLFSGQNVSVHTGMSILVLSQEYTDFINHYLNITVEHHDSNSSYITEMNNLLKLTLGLKAIAGGIYKFTKESGAIKNKTAEVILLNDSSGKYKLYFIEDLIDKIANDINLIEIKGLDANKTWKQHWVSNNMGQLKNFSNPNYSDAYSRITEILSQLHAFNLDISLKPSAFI